jgi:hypothetical protein
MLFSILCNVFKMFVFLYITKHIMDDIGNAMAWLIGYNECEDSHVNHVCGRTTSRTLPVGNYFICSTKQPQSSEHLMI